MLLTHIMHYICMWSCYILHRLHNYTFHIIFLPNPHIHTRKSPHIIIVECLTYHNNGITFFLCISFAEPLCNSNWLMIASSCPRNLRILITNNNKLYNLHTTRLHFRPIIQSIWIYKSRINLIFLIHLFKLLSLWNFIFALWQL